MTKDEYPLLPSRQVATKEEMEAYSAELFDLLKKGAFKLKVWGEGYPFTAEGIRQAHEDLSKLLQLLAEIQTYVILTFYVWYYDRFAQDHRKAPGEYVVKSLDIVTHFLNNSRIVVHATRMGSCQPFWLCYS